MKFLFPAIFVLAIGSTALAQDCKNGRCPLVQVPKAVVSESVQAVKEVASVPVKVTKKVHAKKPVRGFLKKLFRKG